MLPAGHYACFFEMRVDTAKDQHMLFSHFPLLAASDISLWQSFRALRKIWKRLWGRQKPPRRFRTFMTGCAACHSITPSHEYSFEDLQGLYRDYRSKSYNRDRVSVEPSYAKLARNIGDHPLEIINRNKAADAFLRKNAAHFAGGVALDYGGSDGRFLTPFMYETFSSIEIFEPSDVALHATVGQTRVSKTASPSKETYAFLACMHVLEHVGNPRAMVLEARDFLVHGGLMYIEVPHELDTRMRNDFAHRIVDTPILIHEHINKFDILGMQKLVESIDGLELLDCAQDQVDQGYKAWDTGVNGRFLIRKR